MMKREQQPDPLKQKMIELLEQNHWSQTVIIGREIDQRVLHEYLVEGKTLKQIAQTLHVSSSWVRCIKERALIFLERYNRGLGNTQPVIGENGQELFPVLNFDYDVLLAMQQPDESRIDEVKQQLSIPVEYLQLSLRAFNAFKHHKVNYLRDVVAFKSSIEISKFRNIGAKGIDEIETLVYDMGLKWIGSPAFAKYTGQAITRITLPLSYPISNFTWSAQIQQAFKELNITTLAELRMNRTLLLEKKLAQEHFNFIERRLKEWGLKWN